MVPVGGRSAVTVKVAIALVALPAALPTTTRNWAPLSATVRRQGVARRACSGDVDALALPLVAQRRRAIRAATLKVADCPGSTATLAGCVGDRGLSRHGDLWTIPGFLTSLSPVQVVEAAVRADLEVHRPRRRAKGHDVRGRVEPPDPAADESAKK